MPAIQTINELDTPCVLIDVDRASANILRAQAYANAHGKQLRPHVKTHKLPFWAKKQIEAGAIGITCQKIGETEAMADAGLTDIFRSCGTGTLTRMSCSSSCGDDVAS